MLDKKVRGAKKLVDQPEYGTNTSYLVDFIQITFSTKLLNFDEVKHLYLNQGLSAAQIGRKFEVAKSVILKILHDHGVRLETGAGRINNPSNYRARTPPYGYRIQDGRLVPNKAEIKICRLVVELINRKGLSANAAAKELGNRGLKNRAGSKKWDHSTVRSIFQRWNGKV